MFYVFFFVKFLYRKKRHLVCYNASCDNNYYELYYFPLNGIFGLSVFYIYL